MVDALLPDLPGGRRSKTAVLLALVLLSIGDGVWLKGALFGSLAWRICLWGLMAGGVLMGALAWWRQR